MNDYCLKIHDQYYTINNTINITNNNSLLSNFSNNNMSNKKNSKYENNDNNNNIKNMMKNIFRFIDKDNNGYIVLNNRQKIFQIFNRDNSSINREILKILEKMIKILYKINKKNNNIDFDDDKIIIKENIFVKHMIYIYNNKLNINEKKIFFSAKNDFDKIIKKDLLSY